MAHRASQDNSAGATGGVPHYFPDAFGNGTPEHGTARQPLSVTTSVPYQHAGYQLGPQDRGRTGSLNRGYHTLNPSYRLSPSTGGTHPLDTIVNEAYMTQKKGTWPPPSQAGHHQAEYSGSVGVMTGNTGAPASNYPWRYAHSRVPKPPGVEDSQQSSDSGSVASSGSHGPVLQTRLSPTTHVLVVDDQTHETFV